MAEYLFSLSASPPEGFKYCGEFRSRDFRRGPFALHAPSTKLAMDFLGGNIPRLAGVILVPGEILSSRELAPLISRIVFPETMLPFLASFATQQVAQIMKLIENEERCSFLTLENKRFEFNNQLAAEEFNRFRAGLLREMEERRAAERQLVESERRFRAIFEQTFQFIGLLDLDGKLLEANQTALNFTRATDEVIGRPFWDTPWWSHSPEIQERIRAAVKSAAGGEFVRFEITIPSTAGTLHHIDFSLKPVTDETGKVVMLIPEGRDISKRKMAENELRRDKALLRCLIDSVADLIFIKDNNGVYRICNKAAEEFIGMTESEQIGKTDFDFFSREIAEKIREADRLVLASGKEERIEEKVPCRDGSVRLFDTLKTPYYGTDGKQLGLVGISRDITRRKHEEDALRESEELFHTLCDHAPIGIFRTDFDGHITYCSPRWEIITGQTASDAMGCGWTDVIHPDDFEEHRKAWNETVSIGGNYSHEHRLLTAQGETVWVRTLVTSLKNPEGGISSYIGIMEDVGEIRHSRLEMLKNQKIESLGVLAGGIAHDFNNILTVILGNISLARFQLNDREKSASRLKEAETAAARAKELAQQLLTFARGGNPVKKTVDTRLLLRETAGFALHGSNVRGVFTIADDLWPVEADEGQLCQVVQNLVLNAVEAMPAGGTVTISAENAPISEDGKRMVNISVEDSGIGISEEHLQNIFDPYFTTKQMGSGLGLATCYSIVNKHGGNISATSTLGRGSTFHISLPASGRTLQPEPVLSTSLFAGSGHIMVMDDEEEIREIVKAILEELGYMVETAENGPEAVKLYQMKKEMGSPFSAVILDLTIPGGIGGKEVIEMLLEIDPGIKAIVSSGYSTDPIMANYLDYGFSAVLVKPYRFHELSKVLQEVLS